MSHVIERPPARRGRLLVLAGGLVVLVALVLAAVLLLGRGGDAPEVVAADYLDAQQRADAETLCDLSSKERRAEEFAAYEVDGCGDYVVEVQKAVDAAAEEVEDATGETLTAFVADLDVDLELGDVDRDGDEARIGWTSSTTYRGDNDEVRAQLGLDEAQEDEGTMLLCKEGGAWKVRADHAGPDDEC